METEHKIYIPQKSKCIMLLWNSQTTSNTGTEHVISLGNVSEYYGKPLSTAAVKL